MAALPTENGFSPAVKCNKSQGYSSVTHFRSAEAAASEHRNQSWRRPFEKRCAKSRGSLICESRLGDFLALKVVGISQSDSLQNFLPPANAEIFLMKDQVEKILLNAQIRPGHEQAPAWDLRKVNNRQKDYIDPQ